MNLTPKQRNILIRIRDFRLTRGYSPTMQELADTFKVSKVTIYEHVQALLKKGALQGTPHRARSLQVSDEVLLPDEQRGSRVPLVGRIAAGSPIEAVEDRQFTDLDELFGPQGRVRHTGEVFALLVSGESMIDAGILDGDYVICERRNFASNGETVVALINNEEATLKKFYKDRGRIRLQPANEKFEPLWVDNCQIQGVVIGLIRAHR